jgi:hypothetical protein
LAHNAVAQPVQTFCPSIQRVGDGH